MVGREASGAVRWVAVGTTRRAARRVHFSRADWRNTARDAVGRLTVRRAKQAGERGSSQVLRCSELPLFLFCLPFFTQACVGMPSRLVSALNSPSPAISPLILSRTLHPRPVQCQCQCPFQCQRRPLSDCAHFPRLHRLTPQHPERLRDIESGTPHPTPADPQQTHS